MNPQHLFAIYRILSQEYARRYSPVSRRVAVRRQDPFRILVFALLSTRTRDETTRAVSARLFRKVKHPSDLRRLSLPTLERWLRPIGFFRTKARHLKRLPDVLDARFGGRIPDTLEGLLQLPGVGRKVATLVWSEAFGGAAICVDTHVHRISNRLGLVRTRTPEETERALNDLVPRRYWKAWNTLLVSFGQTVCLPRYARCPLCPIRRYCARNPFPR